MDSVLHIQGDPDSGLAPLILVHAVSGLALPYFALGPLSDTVDDRPVYGISSPAFNSQTYKLPSSLEEVAKQYVALVRRHVQAEGPYLLGGWSMGGMIASRMAEILEHQGETVLHIIMIDSGNPEVYPPFKSRAEHETVSDIMYAAVTKLMAVPSTTACPDSDGEDSMQSSDDSDDDGDLSATLSAMRRHIHNGLKIISGSTQTRSSSSKFRLRAPATLIKCTTQTQPMSQVSDRRKEFARKLFGDEKLGWKDSHFKSLQTMHVRATHDGVFDKAPAQQLTRLVRGILDKFDE